MAKITLWDKVLEKLTGTYSEKTNAAIREEMVREIRAKREAEQKAQEAELLRKQKEIAEAILAEAEKTAQAEKAAKKIAEVKAAAKPQVKKTSTPKKAVAKDGDGDGLVNDGKKTERPAPKKKATPAKKKPSK